METCARVLEDGATCGHELAWHDPCSKCAAAGRSCPEFRDAIAQRAADLDAREARLRELEG